jgi:hypothetical protein
MPHATVGAVAAESVSVAPVTAAFGAFGVSNSCPFETALETKSVVIARQNAIVAITGINLLFTFLYSPPPAPAGPEKM